ncbi:MAG: DegT/DnrJ/EryC1/StrS family aminotransferase [Ardenticatenales bacterium]|nr:DegT/DnrJ/EryC1/StrS family aminotransferase [Ardenticatenales bacterium]
MSRTVAPTAAPLSAEAWRAAWATLSQPAGREADHFAAQFAAWSGAAAAWPTASGRAALLLVLQAMHDLRPSRHEVLLPAYTCPVLVPAIEAAGLRPVLVDLTVPEMAFDLAMGAERASEQTLAVIHVHPFGLPRPIQPVRTIADRVGAWLIEDCAQAMGAPVGADGDAALFSLGPGKALSTGGGGLLTANHAALTAQIHRRYATWPLPNRRQSLLALLRLAATAAAFRPLGWRLVTALRLNGLGDSEALRGVRTARLSEGQAAVAQRLLPSLHEVNAARRQRARSIQRQLPRVAPIQTVPVASPDEAIYLRLPLLVADDRRDALLNALQQARLGAGRMYPAPLHRLFPALADRDFDGAETIAERLITLPTHHHVGPTEIARIVATVAKGVG